MQDEVLFALPGDLPVAVMQRHVVISAEQNAAIDIGTALIFLPLINVMCFAIRGRAVAPSPPTPTITNRKRNTLARSEQPLLTPHIKRIPARIDRYGHEPGVTDALLSDRSRNRHHVVFTVRDRSSHTLRIHDLHESHAGLAGSEHSLRIGKSARAQHIEDKVVRELVVRARIINERRSPFPLVRVNKPRATTPRTHRRSQHRLQEQITFVVEHDARALLAILITVRAERPLLEPRRKPCLRTLRVKKIPDAPRLMTQLLRRALTRRIDQLLGRLRPRRTRVFARRGNRLSIRQPTVTKPTFNRRITSGRVANRRVTTSHIANSRSIELRRLPQPALNRIELRRCHPRIAQRRAKRLEPGLTRFRSIRPALLARQQPATRRSHFPVVNQRLAHARRTIRLSLRRPGEILNQRSRRPMPPRRRQTRMPLLTPRPHSNHTRRRHLNLLNLSRQRSSLSQDLDDLSIRHVHHRRLRTRNAPTVGKLPTQGGDQRRDVGESCHT